MATEKFGNEKTVTIETSKLAASPKNLSDFLPKQKNDHFYKVLIYFYILAIVITVLSIAKIPWCGSYLDAYVFEFMFGTYIKFIVYFFILFFCFNKIFSKWKICKFLISKQAIIGWVCLIISAILINTVIYEFTNNRGEHKLAFDSFLYIGTSLTNYVNDFKTSVDKYINHFSPYIWPPQDTMVGLIGNLIFDLWGLIVTIVTTLLVLLLVIIAILCLTSQTKSRAVYKFKTWLAERLSRSKISEKIVNELNASNDDVKPAIVQKYEIKQEALHSSSATPPISFLSETSVDNFLSCKVEAKQYADIITNFLHKFDSIVHYQSTVVAPLYCEISYDVEKQSIVSDIFANQEKILEELKIGAFNLLYKNNSVRFEILNKTPSKISLKSILASCKNVQPNQYVVGADESGKPLLVDISKNTNTVLMGTKGSGVSMLMTVMLVSLAYTNTPKKMGMIVLSPRSDKSLKYLSRLPHLTLPVQHEQLEITKALTNLQIEINNREALFAKSKVRSLKEYNDKNNNEVDNLKQMVVVINNFNIISKISVENYRLIIDLLKRGASVGVSVILMTNNVDHQLLDKDIYKNLDVKLVMKLEFEQESIQLLDSRRGVELFGNGDGYYFDNKLKINLRFQSCYMNIDELDQIVKIIETFYSVKSKLI